MQTLYYWMVVLFLGLHGGMALLAALKAEVPNWAPMAGIVIKWTLV